MPATDPQPASDLDLLRRAGEEAGRIALRYFGKQPEVWMKAGNSPVTEADYAVDRFLRETLLAARPDYGWLSEETADAPQRLSARRTFVVDPIDGTRGFMDGRAAWCVSLAVVEDGCSVAGVLECPAKRETYWAEPAGGAWCNGRRIGVRLLPETPQSAGPKPMLDMLPAEWQRRMRREAYIPSLAYRIALIAGGQLDATFVKANAHDWDIAAADLILREAGGRIIDAGGKAPSFARATVSHGPLAAGSGALLDAMAGVLRSFTPG
ncbi:MAG: 3'(2'),5'-bisphosphate nucleotidase CysQ [Rhizobiaceae bacterium]|nr:3'(2'),5'-bisphosphate nucleotidase CysQ [Rhizobiaceae bacterium]